MRRLFEATHVLHYLLGSIAFQQAALASQGGARRLLAPPSERVSILDGVLPSPELGPRAMAGLTFAPSPQPVIVSTTLQTQDFACGPRCITGSILGGVAFLAILLCICLWFFFMRSGSVKDDVMSTSDLELLDHPVQPSLGSMKSQYFDIGDNVFCQKGRNCTFGKITDSSKGGMYIVSFYDGSSAAVQGTKMAHNYAEGTQVLYQPPGGRSSMTGTIVQADGSYWPPFYQLTPDAGDLTLVNTTAECLSELKKGSSLDVPAKAA